MVSYYVSSKIRIMKKGNRNGNLSCYKHSIQTVKFVSVRILFVDIVKLTASQLPLYIVIVFYFVVCRSKNNLKT